MTVRQDATLSSRHRTEHGRRPPQPGFRPDIEGLRAVAILAVVLFHAKVPGAGGGYIGVDVFFVISGFLITGLLWREVNSSGTVRLPRFYAARARRLLPASATVGVVTGIGAAVLLPPLQARSALRDGIASALYVGNYRFALQGTDYLAADTPPSLFQHYWSLGVEEQFYLLWPALIIATTWLVRHAGRRTGIDAAHSQTPYLVMLGLVAAGSFGLALVCTDTSPPWAFFSLPTRAWELAAGGLVALTAPEWHRLPALAAAIAGWGGLTLIVLTCAELNSATPYPGTAALLPVLGTVLVIGAGCAGAGAGRVLALPGLRAIGRVSYAWYLWHWPVLLLLPALVGQPDNPMSRLAAVLVSCGLAVLTLHLVENPVRFAAALRRSAAASLALGAAVTTLAVAVDLVLLALVPAPVGHGLAIAAPKILATPPSAAPSADPLDAALDAAVRQTFAQAQSAVAASADRAAVPSNLTPPLADAPADKPAVFVNGCVRSWREVGQSECATGDTTSPTTVALVGDSHAAMWNPALQRLAEQRHWRLETLGKVTCPLMDLPITSPYLGRPYTECEQWRAEIMARLRAEHPRLVVLSMSRRYGADFGFTSYDPAWIASLTRLVAQLRSTGAQVLVLGPIPDPHSTVPACLSAHLDDATACSPARTVAVNQAGIAAEEAATNRGGGHYADLTELFCTAERCPAIVGNTLVYRDDNHVTIEYAQVLAPVIGALADRASSGN
ncbi:acyltransferase family protein [Mycobacterium botniense]|uniref:Acyltransferase n=1 Tax=Mycobacterium botniense TaxID=84962 RepID=A0A7I9XV69_9MYCO|nr:acyltransferase family protein [Mycobacterium botniense]GFG73367.1 acyltransferase [Mycobacterium botniense]